MIEIIGWSGIWLTTVVCSPTDDDLYPKKLLTFVFSSAFSGMLWLPSLLSFSLRGYSLYVWMNLVVDRQMDRKILLDLAMIIH